MTAAFKEWAVVVDALARGEQIFILRKGGIHEGQGGFRPDYPDFLFFPTLFHQQRAAVIPSAQKRYDEIAPFFPPKEILRLEYWAHLEDWLHLEDAGTLQRLAGQHIWQDDILLDRFQWGREHAIFALILRVYRLPVALELPMLPEYGGCKSWVQIAHPVQTAGSNPVLADPEFTQKVERFRAAVRL